MYVFNASRTFAGIEEGVVCLGTHPADPANIPFFIVGDGIVQMWMMSHCHLVRREREIRGAWTCCRMLSRPTGTAAPLLATARHPLQSQYSTIVQRLAPTSLVHGN
jgi:hypothetical protein